ncbi:Single-stranded-DNA-specific exonuclease RecJ [Hartmannibacter diazotrophicus]|uniref:Single-stranded-DNA-specific exonuclease RecJ n=1 Tax=Hartmannibacter diazotrophicus TaxID=1482074 RepID=A0A2C9D999_9HYPH|nr:single-stranded-DNA-specific exonuclease RecJ [Hartmannibacter diazotrophicus]SON56311.1 Single-stranded-DNA-specific exonuclease RecJ [Hartmannibacter diazotrophicus]
MTAAAAGGLAGDTGGAGRAILGVERSASGRRWVSRLDTAGLALAAAITQRQGLPDILGRVLAAKGVDEDEAERFLSPSLKDLMPDPSVLRDMDAAAGRIADAIEAGRRIAIFGDYDVDGATSSAMMARFLRMQGLDPTIFIPDRIVDGYGPNPRAIEALKADGAELLITVDCGTQSFEAFETAKRIGLDVVAFDHHQASEELPFTEALVNPNRQDDLSGLGYLCAAGVTFLGIVAINRELRRRGWYSPQRQQPDLMALLDLAALGTVCDVVPLVGLNRALVTQGLKVARTRGNRGLAALCDIVRLNGPITAYHFGFMIGPRINAGGRIGDAALGARLLASDDMLESSRIAAELDALNRERQTMEAEMLAQAEADVAAMMAVGEPPVIVVSSPLWHPGIVGLIASRLKERHNRPAFAIALGDDGFGTGSGRSIPGVDLGKAVRLAKEAGLIVKGGGHAMAAGLTVAADGIAGLEAYLGEALADDVREASGESDFSIDGALTAAGATTDLIGLLERAGPYGAGQPEPVFAFPMHKVVYAEEVGNQHVRLQLASSDGTRIKGMAFRAGGRPLGDLLLGARGRTVHVAGVLTLDHWQGEAKPQLRVLDAADPQVIRA